MGGEAEEFLIIFTGMSKMKIEHINKKQDRITSVILSFKRDSMPIVIDPLLILTLLYLYFIIPKYI
jgi:hypothetical protein